MNPVGPLPPKVYWLRRSLVIAVAVIVLIGLIWIVVSKAGGNPDKASADAPPSTPSSTAGLTGVLASDPATDSSAGSGSDPASGSPSGSTTKSSVSSSKSSAADSPAKPTKPAGSSGAGSSPATKGTESVASAPAPERRTTPPAQTTQRSSAKTTPKATTSAPATSKPAASKPSAGKPATTTSVSKPASSKPTTSKPTSSKPPAPTTDAQGRLLCTDGAIALATTSRSTSYAVGSQPILGLTVTNTSGQSCVRDVSGTKQVFTVYDAAKKRVWSTSDCFPGSGTDVRMLNPGESLQYNIKWAGTTSTPGCKTERVPVSPGSYTAVAQLGGLTAKPVTVKVTG